jgi:hypothetical protein
VCFYFLYNFCLKRHDFRIKLLNKNLFLFSLQLLFETARFSDKTVEQKCVFLIFSTTFVWNGTIFG